MASPPENLAEPRAWKLAAIDYAIDQAGVKSFADLGGIGIVYGQYAFYALDQPGVERGVLIDDAAQLDHEWVTEEAARRGLRTLSADFADPNVAEDVGPVDCVLLFEVLLHAARPDWDEVLAMWAPYTQTFVIANPQWDGSSTIRLIDLGPDEYRRIVPDTRNHAALFDRLDQMAPRVNKPWRDAHMVWQWGITDADLKSVLRQLGFSLLREETIGPFSNAVDFSNRTFVFSRQT